MPDVSFQSGTYPLEQHESVLDCLLRHGKAIPYACKAGMCQACLVKSLGDKPPEDAGKWVKKTLREKGYCLACQWVPDDDVKVALPNVAEFSVEVVITGLQRLNERVMRVEMKPVEAGSLFPYEPGQYLTLINPQGLARSYSIANDFEQDGFVELHIASTRHGVFTHWLFSEARVGDHLHARGPAGECFYTTPESDTPFPLILAGTGTGLAPLYGIANQALKRGHRGTITLFHGASEACQLYYTQELQNMASAHEQFCYVPVCQSVDTGAPSGCQEGSLEAVATAMVDAAELPSAHVYLCGNPDFVHALRKQLFLKGARSANIYCDPFLERTVATDKR